MGMRIAQLDAGTGCLHACQVQSAIEIVIMGIDTSKACYATNFRQTRAFRGRDGFWQVCDFTFRINGRMASFALAV